MNRYGKQNAYISMGKRKSGDTERIVQKFDCQCKEKSVTSQIAAMQTYRVNEAKDT